MLSPFSTTAAAVSSQEDSMARMRIRTGYQLSAIGYRLGAGPSFFYEQSQLARGVRPAADLMKRTQDLVNGSF
jgi:hypothetical protein